jgi:hypothetical protein
MTAPSKVLNVKVGETLQQAGKRAADAMRAEAAGRAVTPTGLRGDCRARSLRPGPFYRAFDCRVISLIVSRRTGVRRHHAYRRGVDCVTRITADSLRRGSAPRTNGEAAEKGSKDKVPIPLRRQISTFPERRSQRPGPESCRRVPASARVRTGPCTPEST